MPVVIPERTDSASLATAIAAATTFEELRSACSLLAGAVSRVEVEILPAELVPTPVVVVPVDEIPLEPVVDEPIAEEPIGVNP